MTRKVSNSAFQQIGPVKATIHLVLCMGSKDANLFSPHTSIAPMLAGAIYGLRANFSITGIEESTNVFSSEKGKEIRRR